MTDEEMAKEYAGNTSGLDISTALMVAENKTDADYYEKQIADLEKKNEELTEQNSHLYNDLTMTEAENAERKAQLTKAKEIIKLLIKDIEFCSSGHLEGYDKDIEQAEQFLKEGE